MYLSLSLILLLLLLLFICNQELQKRRRRRRRGKRKKGTKEKHPPKHNKQTKKTKLTTQSLTPHRHRHPRPAILTLPIQNLLDRLGRTQHVPVVPPQPDAEDVAVFPCPSHHLPVRVPAELVGVAEEGEARGVGDGGGGGCCCCVAFEETGFG